MTERRPVDDLVDEVAEEVRDPRVLEAIRAIPRERFVQEHLRRYAYEDSPLPIGRGQTISQPTIVGMMTEALALTGDERVLEIGTGSGYQAAVLARLCRELVTVEVIDELREGAERVLHALGITNVRVLRASDDLGAPAFGPYDAIIVTAAAPSVPAPLLEQLAEGGRLIIPVGTREEQRLVLVTRTTDGTTTRNLGACRFVPLVGPHGFSD
ncbi:MAG: protein-L-isoaspartate(D-aspartate) O-methyltransferase [Dehalococcoidia bacterium]|nr:protein-L-isoaspartate(D-aspartate) O-methyltransferase [Dehalococcoidia bacterium]